MIVASVAGISGCGSDGGGGGSNLTPGGLEITTDNLPTIITGNSGIISMVLKNNPPLQSLSLVGESNEIIAINTITGTSGVTISDTKTLPSGLSLCADDTVLQEDDECLVEAVYKNDTAEKVDASIIINYNSGSTKTQVYTVETQDTINSNGIELYKIDTTMTPQLSIAPGFTVSIPVRAISGSADLNNVELVLPAYLTDLIDTTSGTTNVLRIANLKTDTTAAFKFKLKDTFSADLTDVQIADLFNNTFNQNPSPTSPISVQAANLAKIKLGNKYLASNTSTVRLTGTGVSMLIITTALQL